MRRRRVSVDFICPSCENTWSMEADADGLFDGYGNPPCRRCGTNGSDPSDYGDFSFPNCHHQWRNYGDGGLVLGMWPDCPRCGATADQT
jgi:hypothetical protein